MIDWLIDWLIDWYSRPLRSLPRPLIFRDLVATPNMARKREVSKVKEKQRKMSKANAFSTDTFRKRKPCCQLCRNHKVESDSKGHKSNCKFIDCTCGKCENTRERRKVMRKQVWLRRKQMREFNKQKKIQNLFGSQEGKITYIPSFSFETG